MSRPVIASTYSPVSNNGLPYLIVVVPNTWPLLPLPIVERRSDKPLLIGDLSNPSLSNHIASSKLGGSHSKLCADAITCQQNTNLPLNLRFHWVKEIHKTHLLLIYHVSSQHASCKHKSHHQHSLFSTCFLFWKRNRNAHQDTRNST